MPVRARTAVALALAVAALVSSGCGDDDTAAPTEQDPVDRQVDIYAEVLRAVVVDADPAFAEAGPPVVYVAARGGEEPINVDVQAGVVVELEEWTTIRFVDTVEEAVDVDAEGAPVRDDGVLVGLGPVPEEGRIVDVYADRYEGPDRTVVFEVTVRRTSDGWSVDEPLDGVPVATPIES